MKTLLPLGLLLAAMPLVARPVLHINSNEFTPETTFKLTFDQPVVSNAQVGQEFDNTILKIEPPVAGTIKWVEPNVALFQRAGTPAIGTTFTFSLAPGFRHQDGSEIPAGKLRTLATGPFLCEYGYWRGHTRTPSYFVRFNDEVDPNATAAFFQFVDKDGKAVAATVRRGVYGDLSTSRALGPTWEQRFSNWASPEREGLDPNFAIASAVTVTPVHPLPVGENWKLAIKKDLPNASGTARLGSDLDRWIGSVRSFEVASISAVTRVDSPRYVAIGLSKALPENADAALLSQFVTIEPQPEDMKLVAKRSLVSIEGDYSKHDQWKVTVKSGLLAADGLALIESKSETVKFSHLEPVLAGPSYAAAQLALGSRTYSLETVNLASARIRVKRLSGVDAVRTLQGYRHYSGDGPGDERISSRHTIPWSLVAGEPIHDQTVTFDNDYDTSRSLDIHWDEVLGADRPHGLLFLAIEGTPKEGMEPGWGGTRLTQVFLQLTDIGLAWKLNAESAFVYAYSCHTGQPLANVQLDVFGEDAAALQSARTNDSGVALLPRTADQRHLRASLGTDTVLVAFDDQMPTVSMWRFPVRTEWNPQLDTPRTAMLFTDRALYRPGEEVHLKGIVRRIENNRSVFDTSRGAQLVIRDSSERVLAERDITLSELGSFDHSFRLPAETVGYFSIQLLWPGEIAAAEQLDNWRERAAALNSARFTHNINVQEFRRNAFEVKSEFVESGEPDRLKLDLTAGYYQGQPVAEAEVKWFYRSRNTGFYPDDFRDYLFCDHRTYDAYYWSHYFGYDEDDYHGQSVLTRNGATSLDQNGFASIAFDIDAADFPSPRHVSVTCEVTDQRNQTLGTDASTTIHSSQLYLGVSRVDKLLRVGENLDLKAVAVTSEGKPAGETVAVNLRVEREVNEQVKTKTESGTIAVRNETRIELIEERPLTIDARHNLEGGLTVPFQPQQPGKHILTFSGTDSSGKAFRTAVIRHVYGAKEFPWAYENGMLIKLVPEKKLYQPGETARVLVLSPIEGTALVTLEREGVHRHMIRELTAANPVIEIPLTDEDAPNAYLSVLVIKGSQDNLREHKEPILRLGYCELTVENVRERLQVSMKIPGDYHRPGEEVAIDGLIRDAQGNPVAGAEVTLYAEDEGTLAVAGYENPDPLAHFYAPRSLRIEAGTSLYNILSEDPEQRQAFNKGFFIGGGGEFDENEGPRLRKDFNPCAVWAPALVTDAEGRFASRFVAPDTLTRYRVIAVAHHSAANFGRELGEFVVNKPLMLEPSTPRFAHEGDRLQPKVLVQNATAFTGTWKVSLKLDSITNFVEGSEKEQSKTITIPADGSATVSFDLVFANTGTVDWKWSAQPLSLEGAALDAETTTRLSDAVATSFDVEYPMPLLRETRFVRFQDPSARHNLLDGLSDTLLDGRGELEIEFGRSILLEAGGALDHLLHYPYGCLEQTTSSTVPWIAALNLRDVAPAFRKRTEQEIRGAIQAGANRLLSMQCDDGGLAYWPGGRESEDWASAYGGMVLLLCREAGADVPDSAMTGLKKYLAENLRGIAEKDSWWAIETATRACYTLALAGAPEVAYHNKLLEDPERLSPSALSFLALAIAKSGVEGAPETARKLLETRGTVPQRGGHFLSYHPAAAYRLLALSTIDPDSGECAASIDRILQQRNDAGHWHTTWGNAWTVYALGEYAKRVETQSAPPVIQLATGDGTREIRLDDENPSERVTIPLHGGLGATATASHLAYARVNLASKPRIAPTQAVSTNGLQIARTYHRVRPDGSSEILDQPVVGDLVKVELEVTMPRDGTRYLVVDDPLPSIFEVVNADFGSQAGRVDDQRDWSISHRELRDDRAVFFLDYLPNSGTYTMSYHARVTSAGEAAAPAAKVEAMYEPEFYALSTSRSFKTPNPLHSAMR